MTANELAAAPAVGSGPLSYLPRALRVPREPLAAIAVGWLTAFLPAILIATAVAAVMPDARTPDFPVRGGAALFLLVVFAPVVETAIMATVLLVLLWFARPTIAIFISSAGWAVAHSLEAPIWGLVVWWPFMVFSLVFVVWRERSIAAGFAMAAIVHALNNLLPAVLIAYPELV